MSKYLTVNRRVVDQPHQQLALKKMQAISQRLGSIAHTFEPLTEGPNACTGRRLMIFAEKTTTQARISAFQFERS